jgi:hypothetical protein
MDSPQTKRCSRCGDEKELVIEINSKAAWCKQCFRQYANERYAENPEKFREQSRKASQSEGWIRGGLKPATCEQCGESFQARSDGFMKYCSLKCAAGAHKCGSVTKCVECGTTFYVPKSRKEKARGTYCSKVCADKAKIQYSATQLKLSSGIRCGILKSVKRGSKAGRHWEGLVGYTVDDVKTHLERRFSPGMTWENQGSCWHIDHKIPVAAFNFETPDDIDFKRCWSLKNLRPLWATENMSKGARLDRPFQPSLQIAV